MPKIKCVWSDITYRKNWRVDGWKIWVDGKKYPTSRTYVWSTPNTEKGKQIAIWRSLTQMGHPLAKLREFE